MGQKQDVIKNTEELDIFNVKGKFFKLYYGDTKYLPRILFIRHYCIDLEKIKSLQVGWLFHCIITHLEKEFKNQAICKQFKCSNIVGLKMRNSTEMMDHWLMEFDRPLHKLRENDELELIYSSTQLKYLLDHIQAKKSLQLSDFEVIKIIGKGGFSNVFQVRKKDTGKIYAMKVISKSFVLKIGKAEQIMSERQILSKVSHPFIVSLCYAFQSVKWNCIYFIAASSLSRP